ncbi:annexin-like protein RJ4 [Dendrobium catenatum]|uniref:Annexin-like protein RJ4 n=1 Tax=Dendrobium catenatum TaxID=906689 RepID=A0A2I0VRN9_9ASPA|nr:annexin-like protein RJ4 [Dendrobium catenatum]PKU66071.1 Annexin-like protein RJ4 [Dendrobium catenatum]
MATLRVPSPVPSPVEDAEQLRKACQGWGTDEKKVISVIAHRDAAQRQQIQQAYEELYKEKLSKRLESELTGQFEKAVYRWMFSPLDREAIMAKIALTKGLDYRVIIETSCINSSNHLLAVKQTYQNHYKHSLEEDVASDSNGDLRKLLVGLVSTYRYEGDEVDVRMAHSEANTLHELINKKDFNHDEVIRILTTRSKSQLNATFNKYKDEHGVSILKDLKTGNQDEFVSAIRTAIRCIISPHKYYEKLLRTVLSKSESDEDTLTRVIVTRAEKDLKEIMTLFEKRANVSLEQAIGKHTSGHYKHFLLALVGN